MLHVAASVHRVFLFPAELSATTGFFRDFQRVIRYSQNLRLLQVLGEDQYRILYSYSDGLYRLAFYSDLRVSFDPHTNTLSVDRLTVAAPPAARAGLRSITGPGEYSRGQPLTRLSHRNRCARIVN